MPNFGVNERDQRTAEALEKIWADRRKEQVMSEVKPFEQHEIDAIVREEREFNDVGGCSACDVARFVATIDHWRQRAEQADASADTYALLLRKLTKDDTLLAAYRRSKNLDHRGVPVVSDVVLEMLRKEEAALGREK